MQVLKRLNFISICNQDNYERSFKTPQIHNQKIFFPFDPNYNDSLMTMEAAINKDKKFKFTLR